MGRNFLRKWGEIDIIAKRGHELHFIEVKSDFRNNRHDGYRAEELMHGMKQRRLRRIVATYLCDMGYGLDYPFIFDLAIVSHGKREDGSLYSISLQENVII